MKILSSVLAAAVLALAGWVYSTGNRVAVLEAQRDGIEKQLKLIHEDVRRLLDLHLSK